MLEDIAAADEAMRKIEAGEELVPHVVVSRIIEGENCIRVWREHRGLKVGELAIAAGISQPYLSQLESGDREGSVDSLRKIADALRVAIDDLV
jgi:predicted transcriptional regulator